MQLTRAPSHLQGNQKSRFSWLVAAVPSDSYTLTSTASILILTWGNFGAQLFSARKILAPAPSIAPMPYKVLVEQRDTNLLPDVDVQLN